MPNKKKKRKRLRFGRLLMAIFVIAGAGAAVGFGGVYAYKKFSPAIETMITDRTAQAGEFAHDAEVRNILESNALAEVTTSGFSDEELRSCFYSQEISDKISERLSNMGYTGQIPLENLRYVKVLYLSYDGKPTVGELVVNAEVAGKVENIFYDLYTHKYPIERMILPDAYGTSISESFADNNTVGLCFGLGEENSARAHETGYAIDLNPLHNPLIRDNGSSLSVFPMEGQLYLDRTMNAEHYIHANDYAVEAFGKEDFLWKGNNGRLNDYKHFEYKGMPQEKIQVSEESAGQQTQELPQQVPENSVPEQPDVQEPQDQEPVYEEPAIEEPVYDESAWLQEEPGTEDPQNEFDGQAQEPAYW